MIGAAFRFFTGVVNPCQTTLNGDEKGDTRIS